MCAEHKKDEEAIFNKAIEIKSLAERATFVKSACGEDAALLARVEALLKVHFEDASFLKSPPAGINSTLDTPPPTEVPGMKIDRYKLLQLIGEGGFGVVYMAEQEEPIRRKVALKIIKLGMDTKQVIARFEAERQALAMMDHPNIARVFDAGATDTGRPYFVMELIKGIPITEYCDKNNLDTQKRLELFIDVCKAVQHAHQKGIIHRDIKPTNVMITLHDGKPVPKIIDFGIAKATQHRLTEKTLFTEFRQFIGTPEYMSPEQAEMSGLDVDTRSDIYSLGVLLYELLTGTTPFEAEKLRIAAYDEIRRIIREDEPPRPSTRLSTLGENLTDIAKHRDAQPNELRKIVRGDLDWIVMKTLEKDRTRRYETANGLAVDIERHLSDEPVSAGPPSVRYRMHKFVRRHKTGVASGLLALTAIVIGLVVSTTMYFRAEQAREKEASARLMAEQARQKEAAARTEAVAARDVAERAESISQQQRLRAQRLLARSQIERGINLLNEGDNVGLLYLLDARQTADKIPDIRDQASRLWAIAYDLWTDRLVQVFPYADNIAFSPDGGLLAITNGRAAQLWDTATGRPHTPPLNLRRIIGAIVFSPDGKLLATHSIEGVSRLWDTATGQPAGPVLQRNGGPGKSSKRRSELAEAYWSAAFSPDGKLLATACFDGTVRLWETSTGQPYGQPLQHEGEVWTVAFSPDGNLLASGAEDNTAQLWEVANRQPYGPVLRHGERRVKRISKVTFSPDGKLVMTLSPEDSVKLWVVETVQLHKQINPGRWTKDVAFSPDGELLATTTLDWTARLWDTKTGRSHGEQLHHEAAVETVAFSPDGRILATGSADKTLRLWDAANCRPYGQPLHHQDGVGKVVFSEDGKYIATLTFGGTTRIWKTLQSLNTEVVLRQSGNIPGSVSSDGELIGHIILNGEIGAVISGKTIHLWDTTTFKPLCEPLQNDGPVYAVTFSPDGKLLAAGSRETAQLWDVTSGRPFGQPLNDIEEDAKMLAFNPDGKLLAAAAYNGETWVFDVITGRLLHTFFCGGRVCGASFSPDSKVLATASENGLTHQWDVANGRQLASPLRHPAQVWAVEFSPDGKLLATASGEGGRTVRLWDISIGPPYHSLELPSKAIRGSTWWNDKGALESFRKDGTILFRILPEGKARVWRVPEAPADLREMQLRTWIALGAEHNKQGETTAIQWQKWQKLLKELHTRFAKTEKSEEYYLPLVSEFQRYENEQSLIEMQEEVEIKRSVFGEGHPETLNSLNGLFRLYEIQGRYDEAERMLTEGLEISCRTLGEDEPNTLRIMHNLAAWYHRQGRYSEAESLYAKVLKSRRSMLGEEHTDTLSSIHDLGWMYCHQGRYKEAEPLFIEQLEIRRRLQGEEHKDTMNSMHDLGWLYCCQGRYKESEQMFVKSLENQRRVLGEEHEDTLWTLSRLGEIHSRQGQYEEAETMLVKALEGQRRTLGMQHPDALWSLSNLINLYEAQGKPQRVEQLLGKDNSFMLNQLAWYLSTSPEAQLRNGVKAIEYATKACELTDWKEANIVDTLAAAYAEASDFDSAVKWQKKAIDLLTGNEPAGYRAGFEARLKLYQSGKPYHGP